MNITMQIKLNKISQIAAEIFKKLGKNHRFEPIFWEIFKNLLMRCAHFSMLLKCMKPIDFFFSKSMYIVPKYQSISRHQFEQHFIFVQQAVAKSWSAYGASPSKSATSSFCYFLQKIICQENTVGVKKYRVVFIEAEFYRLCRCLILHNHVPRLVPHLPRMLDMRRFTQSSFSPHEDRSA